MLKTLIALGFAGAVLVAAPAEGQDLACPQAHVCVDYGNTAIAIDPAQGPVQALVVREQTIETTTFEGTQTTNEATLAVYVSNGDTYDLESEKTVDREGLFETATLGDVYVLMKVQDAD